MNVKLQSFGWVKSLVVSVGLVLACNQYAHAQVWNQTTAATYSWNSNANWGDGSAAFPNGQGVSATISTVLAGDQTINLGQAITLGTLSIGSATGSGTTAKYTVSGSTLTMDNGVSEAVITHSSAGTSTTDYITSTVAITSAGLRVTNLTGNNVTLSGTITGTGNITMDGGGVNLNGAININGTITAVTGGSSQTGTSAIAGALGSGVTSLIINRASKANTLALGGTNSSFTGTVVITKGTLRITGTSALNANNVVSMSNTTDASLNLYNNVTIAGLNGSGTLGAGTAGTMVLTLGGSGTYSFNPGGSSDSASNMFGLNVALTGSGSQTLTGALSTRGGVAVTSGRLILAAADVFKGSNYSMGVFTLNGGTLSSTVANVNFGTGYAGGSFSVVVAGGTMDLNGASAGTMTVGNTLSGSAASNFTMSAGTIKLTLNSAVDYDKIIGVTAVGAPSTFTISGGTIDFGNTVTDYVSTYQIFSGFGSGNVSGLNFINYDTTNYLASIDNSGVLSFTAIPEPGTYVLVAMGMMVVGFVAFRKRMQEAS